MLVTIPLFTALGYVLAESKAPQRIVEASRALFGWLPGGLAVGIPLVILVSLGTSLTTLDESAALALVYALACALFIHQDLSWKDLPRICLGLVMAVPWMSTVLVQSDIEAARRRSAALGLAPREAWDMECVQQDTLNPKPCSEADKLEYAEPNVGAEDDVDEALLKEMMGP